MSCHTCTNLCGQFVIDDDVLEGVGAASPSEAVPTPARPAPTDHEHGSTTQKPAYVAKTPWHSVLTHGLTKEEKIRHRPFVGLIERRVVRPFFFDPPQKTDHFCTLATCDSYPGSWHQRLSMDNDKAWTGCPWTRRGQVQSDWSIVGISEISLI